jgi:hypothetical protein
MMRSRAHGPCCHGIADRRLVASSGFGSLPCRIANLCAIQIFYYIIWLLDVETRNIQCRNSEGHSLMGSGMAKTNERYAMSTQLAPDSHVAWH